MKKLKEHFVIDKNGKRTAVIIPLEEYERWLEDIHDLAVVAERRSEPTVSFTELKRRLKKDGLL